MRSILMAVVVGFVTGALFSYYEVRSTYESKHLEFLKDLEAAEEARLEGVSDEISRLQKILADVESTPPVTVDRIVYVKAKCPVQTNSDGALDNGADALRVELDRGVIRGVERVAYKHKKLYESCALKLRACQVRSSPQ